MNDKLTVIAAPCSAQVLETVTPGNGGFTPIATVTVGPIRAHVGRHDFRDESGERQPPVFDVLFDGLEDGPAVVTGSEIPWVTSCNLFSCSGMICAWQQLLTTSSSISSRGHRYVAWSSRGGEQGCPGRQLPTKFGT